MAPRNIHRKPARGLPLLLVAALLISACGGSSGGDDGGPNEFWVFNFETYEWYTISVTKRLESGHAIIYVDSARADVTDGAVSSLADEFDGTIHPNVSSSFAAPYDADGNGKTILLVLDIQDGYMPPGGAYIGGYFNPADMFQKEASNPYSNEGDIIYIDCYPQLVPDEAKGTISHEFQHLVNFSKNYIIEGGDQMDTWIDEGLSEASTHLCYGVEEDRIDYYNADLWNDIRDGHPLFYWDDSNPLPNYCKSYLFFQYMKAQSASGDGIFKKIIDSPESDYGAVREAMTGDAALSLWDANSEQRFNLLLLRWHATNNGVSNSGVYTYNGALAPYSVTPHLYAGTSVSNLKSGGGVVKNMGSAFSGSAAGFIYMSVMNDGTGENLGSPFPDQDKFVAVFRTYDVLAGSDGDSSLPSSILFSEGAAMAPLPGLETDLRARIEQKPQRVDMVFRRDLPKGLHTLEGTRPNGKK
jgi:hypothetical protein